MVRRSVPLPLTTRDGASQPKRSVSESLTDVLPPPGWTSERSLPMRFERYTSSSMSVLPALASFQVLTYVTPGNEGSVRDDLVDVCYAGTQCHHGARTSAVLRLRTSCQILRSSG